MERHAGPSRTNCPRGALEFLRAMPGNLSRQISAEKMRALDKGSRRARLRAIKTTGAAGERNGRTCLHQYVLEPVAVRAPDPGRRSPRRPHPSSHGGRAAGAPPGRRHRDALPCGARRRLRHRGLCAVGADLPGRVVHLYQVSGLYPHSARSGALLQNRRLLRLQGACRLDRPHAVAGLLVFLEERPESGLRQCAQGRHPRARRDVLVSVHRRPCAEQHPRIRVISTATATSSRTAPSSLAASRKFKAFATTFSIAGPVVYCLIQYFNWPLFTFHPATDRLVWGYEAARPGEGPNMLGYGWTVTPMLIAAGLRIVAMIFP